MKATKRHSNTRAGKRRLDGELIEDKLAQLLAFIGELEKTPEGATQLQRRAKLFGECKRSDGETSGEFSPSCIIGCTGTFKRQNRLSILPGRPIVVQLRKGMHERENEGTRPRSRSIFNSIA